MQLIRAVTGAAKDDKEAHRLVGLITYTWINAPERLVDFSSEATVQDVLNNISK
jgi:hypothetical protein